MTRPMTPNPERGLPRPPESSAGSGHDEMTNAEQYRQAYEAQFRLNAELIAGLKKAQAEAWDEGFDAGDRTARAVNAEWPDRPLNPYREAG